MNDNAKKLEQCFCAALGLTPEMVTDDLAYNSIKQWDSVGHMTLMSEIETVFDIMLDTDDIINLSTVAKARQTLIKYGVDF